jgi:hypothetical protein
MASTNEPVIDAATIAAARSEYRCRNALLWIRTIAGMHYFGGAFDPEHMRSIANLAADALGGKDLPDCLEASRAARARAHEMAAKWSALFDDGPDEDDEDDEPGEMPGQDPLPGVA